MNFKNIPAKHIGVYSLLMGVCAFYWDCDIFNLARLKGDNYLYCIIAAISITYIFYLSLYFTWKKIKPLFFLLMPLIIAFASLAAWFVMLGIISSDTTSTDIIIITTTYLVFSDMFVVLVWRKRTGEERRQLSRHPHAI